MKHVYTLKTLAVVAAAALVGLLAGNAMVGAARSQSEAGVSAAPGDEPASIVMPNYPTNDSGQTYGRIDQGVWPEFEPSLILVVATNGRDGYVLKKTLDEVTGANVSTPEEAVAWEEQRDTRPDRVLIPVFEKDGVTEVGSFEITNSFGKEVVSAE